MLQNFHVLKISYIGPSNTKGSRVKIRSDRFEQTVIFEFDNEFALTIDNAINWLSAHNFTLVGQAEGKDCYYLISTTFEPLKPVKK